MHARHAAKVLGQWDKQGKYVFTRQQLARLFPEDSPKAFAKGLARLVKTKMLTRAVRGVYVNPAANSFDRHVVERVALALRPGHFNYLSLESMLSEYGAISQIPLDRLTIMTTGRKGEYRTPYGVIEFTHTDRAVADILSHVKRAADRPLRIATEAAAWRDLKRVGRNTEMVNAAELGRHGQ